MKTFLEPSIASTGIILGYIAWDSLHEIDDITHTVRIL